MLLLQLKTYKLELLANTATRWHFDASIDGVDGEALEPEDFGKSFGEKGVL